MRNFLLLILLSINVSAYGQAVFNPTTGVVNIPKLHIVGDGLNVVYSVELQKLTDFTFEVTEFTTIVTEQQYLTSDTIFYPNTKIMRIPTLQIVGDENIYAVEMQNISSLVFEVSKIMSIVKNNINVQLGPRPYYLVNSLPEGELKTTLKACSEGPFTPTKFTLGHRGAALQFPEHTKESYIAAHRMGAGLIECDAIFTKDKQLVCRHSQCDLHTTTNILQTPLAEKCTQTFTPYDPITGTEASAKCCTSDINLSEFKTLYGKMDAFNPKATTVEEYVNANVDWRTSLYVNKSTVMTHKESIELFKEFGVKMVPELKETAVKMPYEGTYTRKDFIQQLVNEYKEAGVAAKDVFIQSFEPEDIYYLLKHEPEFGKQGVLLDDRYYAQETFNSNDPSTWLKKTEEYVKNGVQYIAPTMPSLVTLDINQKIIPSEFAKALNKLELKIIAWTIERSGPLTTGSDDFYYTSIQDASHNDGIVYELLDVLYKDVSIEGIFSDWPATTTYYANCMGL